MAGCVVRFAPDLKQSEVVADGFRNPYGMDFNLDGDLFTHLVLRDVRLGSEGRRVVAARRVSARWSS